MDISKRLACVEMLDRLRVAQDDAGVAQRGRDAEDRPILVGPLLVDERRVCAGFGKETANAKEEADVGQSPAAARRLLSVLGSRKPSEPK